MASQSLKPQTRIRDYVVLRVLGKGSYGITYLATDAKNQRSVAIKEYFPMRFAKRGPDGTVNATQPATDDVEDFDSGLGKFLEEAETLAGFRDHHIVEVFDWFEHNGTAYVIMRYEEGGTLSRYLAAHKEPIKESEVLSIFVPLLKGLRTVHAKWFLHRDIKPENIYIRKSGDPLLIDFGTARHAASAKRGGMTEYLTPGYAPPEQYDRRADHGPWTDIYALGSTMYHCVTRIVPYEGRDRYLSLIRSNTDPVTPATQAAPSMYSKELLEIIDWMMAPDHSKRPQSVDDVLVRLRALPAFGEAEIEEDTQPIPEQEPTPEATPPAEGQGKEKFGEEPSPTVLMPAVPPTEKSAAPADEATKTAPSEPSPSFVRNLSKESDKTVRIEPALGTPTPPPAPPPTPPGDDEAVKKPLLLYGAFGAVVVALIGGGLVFWPSSDEAPAPAPARVERPAQSELERQAQTTAEAEQKRIQEQLEQTQRLRLRELLDQCASQLAAGPPTGPSGEQALACYRRVLDWQPENTTALDAIAEIEQSFLDEVQKALESGAYARAKSYVDKLNLLGLGQAEMSSLKDMVERERQEAMDKQQQVEEEQRRREEEQREAAKRRKTPGETVQDKLKDGGMGPLMAVMPAGSMTMGCSDSANCSDDQKPAHEVQIGQPFLVGRYEVTFDEYDRFATATGRPLPDDSGWGRGQRPVINVSWNDAQAYTGWLRNQTGQPYRLLSESEWEYVARAGSNKVFFFGDDESDLCTYGNHADLKSQMNWRNLRCSDGFGNQTAPVGRYSFNAWNVYDTIGNVWEWVADCWHDNYQRAPGVAVAWLTRGGGDCKRHVIRGGSWYDGPGMLLPTVRNWAQTDDRYNLLGFRVAADVN